jgi:transposase
MRTFRKREHVLAIDFSLDHLDVALADPLGAWIIPHQRFENNRGGFQALKQTLQAVLAAADEPVQLTAAGESTANFWWHAFQHIVSDPDFAPYHPALALLNPCHVKGFRRARPEQDKADPQDARLIGAYYQAMGAAHPYTFNERYLPLRHFSRAYFRVVHTLAAEKTYALSLVYLLASEYRRVQPFSEILGATSGHILTAYPDIAALADIPLDNLIADLKAHSHNRLKDAAASARDLQHIAMASYPLPDYLADTLHTVFCMTLDHVRFLEAQQRQYKRLITQQLDQLPEADLALAQPGLGPIIVGGCLGEIQDPRRFTVDRPYRDGQAAVAKLAGLWWPRHSSGRFEGQDRHLARERNPFLRYWLVQAAYALKGKQSDYAAYYQRKYHESSRHQHKRALILTARKAVRLIFALLYKGQMQRLEEAPPPA